MLCTATIIKKVKQFAVPAMEKRLIRRIYRVMMAIYSFGLLCELVIQNTNLNAQLTLACSICVLTMSRAALKVKVLYARERVRTRACYACNKALLVEPVLFS